MLSQPDVHRIAAEACRDPRTVASVYAGRRVNAYSMAAVTAAAQRLGLPPPEAAPASEKANAPRARQGGERSHGREHANHTARD